MKFPPWRLLSASVLVSFAGNFPMGYHTCVVNSAQGVFRRFLNESYDHQFGYSLSNEMYSVLWAGCLSLYDLGAVLGVMFVPLLCDRMGRKWGIVWWSSLPCFLGSLMFYLSHRLWSLELFMAGRFVMGMNGGFMSGAQGIFLTEASPGEFRGFVSSFQELSDCITSLAGMIFGLHQVLGNDANLDALLAIPLIPAGLLMVALLVFPDTPKYLLLTRKDESAAEKSIRFYHGADVDMELAKEEMLAENPESSTTSIRSLWTDTITRKAMLVGIAANFAAVFTGIGAYWNFSTQLFTNVGANFQLSQYATVVMTAVNTAGTLVSMNFVDRLGRRPLLLSSLLGCSLCNVAFLLADQLKLNNVIMGDWLSYVSLSAALLFNLFYSVGAGPVPWFIGAEMSPQKSRAKIQSLSVGSQWLSTVFDTIAFYPLYYLIGSYSILVIFVIPCSLITGFLAYYMPETRDLTIDASEDRASLITPPPATTEDRSIFDPSEAGEEPRSLTE